MIRVNDPTVVTVSMTVKEMALLKSINEKALAAASGVTLSPEEKLLWEAFLLRYEEAAKRQLFIYRGNPPE